MFSRNRTTQSKSTRRHISRRKLARPILALETLEDRRVLASAWHNTTAPLNVDNTDSATVSPLDALMVINELTDRTVSDEFGKLPDSPEGFAVTAYYDVTDDGFVAPLDALRVINELTEATLRDARVDDALERRLVDNPDLFFAANTETALGYAEAAEAQQVGDTRLQPAVVSTDDGGSVIVWVESVSCGSEQDCPTHTILSQRFKANGVEDGETESLGSIENALGNPTPVRDLDVGLNPNGEIWVTWSQFSDGDWNVYLKRPDSGPEIVNETTLGVQRDPAIAVDANGDVLVVWQDDLARRIRGRFYGAFESGELPIEPSSTPADDTIPRISPELSTAADGFFTTWINRADSGAELKGLYIDPSGQILSSVVVSDVENRPVMLGAPSISTTTDGSYAVIAWQQQLSVDAEWEVKLRGFDLGTGSFPEVLLNVNEATFGAGGQPAVAFDQDDILIAWNGYGLNNTDGQFVRRFDLGAASDWISTEANVSPNPFAPKIVASNETAFLASLAPGNRIAVEAVGDDVTQPTDGDGDDLVAFAKAVAESGTTLYGASWCQQCTDQRELFEDGAQFLPFLEVTNADRTPNDIGIDAGITTYPTWVFPDDSRLEGVQDLATIAERSGVAIPKSDTPYIAPIASQTLLVGSPLHVSLDGYDPNGTDLTYSVTSDNPNVTPTLLQGNQSIRFGVDGYGDMVFELFEQRVPRATTRMIELANDHFYDGIIFHRVINNFVIQAGDPNGLGSGGSNLGNFGDQFHLDLQHNRTGLLSMAKSNDDTNDSQFFITEGPTRHLDFNHSIFGVLVEGESVREAISNTETVAERPLTGIAIGRTEVFNDNENAVLMLKAAVGATGTAKITVTATDADGMTYQTTFGVVVEDDLANGGPFLADFDPTFRTTAGLPISFMLDFIDIEDDDVAFGLNADSATGQLDVTMDEATGEVIVTPVDGFVGTASFVVGVRAADGVVSDTSDPWDAELITVEVLEEP